MSIVETVRVCFSKTGRAKYISHLDLMRTMTRVLRRAQIPLWYTEGFSKHPYITFAAPLSLGFEGQCEYMDFRLEQEMPMDEIVSRLNDNMPEGITVTHAAPAVMKTGEIAASRWDIRLPMDDISRVSSVLAQEAIEVQKRTKKGIYKTMDIKPFIQEVILTDCAPMCSLQLTLPTGEQSVNPSLLLDYIYGEKEYAVDVTRLAIFAKNGEIFR